MTEEETTLEKKKTIDPHRGVKFDSNRRLDFNLDRPLYFERRKGEAITGREYTFQRWRRLEFGREGVAEEGRMEKAREMNVKAVALFKEGRLKEAMWYVDKALALAPGYDKALKNRETLKRKMAERKKTKKSKAKKASPKDAVQWAEEVAYAKPQTTRTYSQPAYSQQTPSQPAQSWKQAYRCPGCGIPVRQHWIMCTNCGTDLRRYPPVIY